MTATPTPAMHTGLLDKCCAGAFDGTMTFGETIGHMLSTGVEWYSANLILGCKTHYAPDTSTHMIRWPGWTTPAIADPFDPAAVESAIRAAQRREIHYPEFLRRIAAAGCAYYTVHLRGRRAIYFGRHGDFFIEPFPAA